MRLAIPQSHGVCYSGTGRDPRQFACHSSIHLGGFRATIKLVAASQNGCSLEKSLNRPIILYPIMTRIYTNAFVRKIEVMTGTSISSHYGLLESVGELSLSTSSSLTRIWTLKLLLVLGRIWATINSNHSDISVSGALTQLNDDLVSIDLKLSHHGLLAYSQPLQVPTRPDKIAWKATFAREWLIAS